MAEMLNSSGAWAGIAVFAVVGCLAIELLMRMFVSRYGTAADRYPHRVANQLPRVLYQGDRDEMPVQECVKKARS